MIVMEGEPKEIWSLLPYGESEDPSSPHYNDQTKRTAVAKSSNSGSHHNKSETIQNPSQVMVDAWADTSNCVQLAG